MVTVNQARNVQATFTRNTYALTVTKLGTGSGTVTSDVAGIDCGVDCAETLPHGTVVTLTAAASAGTFTGWGGLCSGTNACVVTVDGVKNVTATFMNQYWLTVSSDPAGSGSGQIASAPSGLLCGDGGTACAELFEIGSTVTLAATGNDDSDFAGWGGACSGTGACLVTIDQAKSVTATFMLKHYDLTVKVEGAGQGHVGSSPAGIDCGNDGVGGSDCVENLEHGSVVTLSATPAPGFAFAWSGACTGSGDCTVTLTHASEAVAEFYDCTNFIVTSDDDVGSGTLREALERACAGAMITFDGDHTIGLTSWQLSINTDLTIDAGAHNVTIDASRIGLNYFNGGVLRISGGHTVVLKHLTLTGGTAWRAGGILNDGSDLTIIDSTIRNNQSFGDRPSPAAGSITTAP